MKKYYADYVRHCLRFYVTTMDVGACPRCNKEVDRNNWAACHAVVEKLSDTDKDIVREIYMQGDSIADKIYYIAKESKVPQDTIWSLVNTLERNVARKRGLL